MERKTCLITGANSGIGKAAAIQIAQLGYHVILACRHQQKGEDALMTVREQANSKAVSLMLVDMSLQADIERFSAEFLTQFSKLDVLIHNAAIFDITQKSASYTAEAIELLWATNHLGPVLMTERLLPALRKSPQARILTVASKGLIAKPFLKVNVVDPEFRSQSFSVETAYYQSKLAQVMYTYWLAEKLKADGITVNCIRVPAVQVDINKYAGLSNFMKKAYAFKSRFALTPEQMAKTYTYLATSDEVANMTGAYFDENNRQVQSRKYARQTENIEAVMQATLRYLKLDQ